MDQRQCPAPSWHPYGMWHHRCRLNQPCRGTDLYDRTSACKLGSQKAQIKHTCCHCRMHLCSALKRCSRSTPTCTSTQPHAAARTCSSSAGFFFHFDLKHLQGQVLRVAGGWCRRSPNHWMCWSGSYCAEECWNQSRFYCKELVCWVRCAGF